MGKGPERFIAQGIERLLLASGHSVQCETLRVPEAFPAEIATSFALYRLLAARIRESVAEATFPLVLAGNCGSTLGVLAGIDTADLGLIWFDGHGDFNTPETTQSGFLDGMGLAMATGRCWRNLTAAIPGFQALPEARIVHIGGRDFDAEEHAALRHSKIAVVEAEQIRMEGVVASLLLALEGLRQAGVHRVHIHLDLDVLDPQHTPANELAPPEGLTVTQVAEAIALVGGHFQICAGTVSAYDPEFDPAAATLRAGLILIETIVEAACHWKGVSV